MELLEYALVEFPDDYNKVKVGSIQIYAIGTADQFDNIAGIIEGFNGPFSVFDVMDISGCSYGFCAWVMKELYDLSLLRRAEVSGAHIFHYTM